MRAVGFCAGVYIIVIFVVVATVPATAAPAPDTAPPTVVACNDAHFYSNTPLQQAYWTEPTFNDDTGITGYTSSIKQGTRLSYGRHKITVTVTDAANNKASCSYTLWITASNCLYKKAPDNTIVTCSINNPQYACWMKCLDSATYSLKGPAQMQCINGVWSNSFGTCTPLGNPVCSSYLKDRERTNHIGGMKYLEGVGAVTCINGPCYYNGTNVYQVCGDAP